MLKIYNKEEKMKDYLFHNYGGNSIRVGIGEGNWLGGLKKH